MKSICFVDTEVSEFDNIIQDFGAVKENGDILHTKSSFDFFAFVNNIQFLCGHNIINHDVKYLGLGDTFKYIDTLYLSPLLFPEKPYHKLVKDEKLLTDELNNPVNDSIKAKELFYDEINAFKELDTELKDIYYLLLNDNKYYSAFFEYIEYKPQVEKNELILEELINNRFKGLICENAPLKNIITGTPLELAFSLAIINAKDKTSITPKWVLKNYPYVDMVMMLLRDTSCGECAYCKEKLNPLPYLKKYFGYPGFRSYNGEPLQENAVTAAIKHKSLLAIFPTGGGKSLTFQIPALMSGELQRALTVVISPLQSLMKDQVDNLEKRGIVEAVTVNGLLDPIERAKALERVENGMATVLYISPEALRSYTIEKLLLSRRIDRFVIDEAHCFSAWGQDFRVDYLYIGDFIKELQEKKDKKFKIPVSCFTATAKQKVISDIKDYFKNKLNIDLELYATNASRTNLRYEVMYKKSDAEKYEALRELIESRNCPTIVYVSRTKRTIELAKRLNADGFTARAFNGKMESSEKQENQNAFIEDKVQIIVATSAFGMGVDKSNVKLVIHYDISDSLENYVQEAGRAGRDEKLQAECYVLFNEDDLDKHFMLLNQTKLSMGEIQQVWRAIKELTKTRPHVCCSPLEVARAAGWDESVSEIETRVKTAIQALENAGYVKRGKNVPRIYANSILVKNMMEAVSRIDNSNRIITNKQKEDAKRIIKSLISAKNISNAKNAEGESRIDYLSDMLGIVKEDVIYLIQQMREDGILADDKDLNAYILKNESTNRTKNIFRRFRDVEKFILKTIVEENNCNGAEDIVIVCINYKQLNDKAIKSGIKASTVNIIKTIFYYWTLSGYLKREQDPESDRVTIKFGYKVNEIEAKRVKCFNYCETIIDYLYEKSKSFTTAENAKSNEILIDFSEIELIKVVEAKMSFKVSGKDVEDALLYLSKIGAMKLEGGFLVLYSGMTIDRIITDNKIRYKNEDYKQLNEYYKQKIQQIHIVGEYANMMVKDYNQALKFVNDYFQMDYKKFLLYYFKGQRLNEIDRNITPSKYAQLFEELSSRQLEIIKDDTSKNIVVAAGPGSGKTKVLVHKLASLMLLEDVKHEQLLMLTFSRAAAIEFKERLKALVGNAAHFINIKTFHSYCFDLIGKIGSDDDVENVEKEAIELIRNGEADPGKITKTVLVIDEAQDMDESEFELVKELMEKNDDLRIIAVGDDDQNIYKFRGSDSKYMRSLIIDYEAKQYSLIDNYRSSRKIVDFANSFVKCIPDRMKTEEIIAYKKSEGEVSLIKHRYNYFEYAVIEDVLKNDKDGTTCILTNSNEEAALLLRILEKRNVPAKIIQDLNSFNIYDLLELRFFLHKLPANNENPIISDSKWDDVIKELKRKYANSNCLPLVLNILKTFKNTNEKLYRNDLEVFLNESKLEDFYEIEQGVITISTIHKSKGREFDNVFMMLKNEQLENDEEKRKLYVGMTRAKRLLHIHYSGDNMDSYKESATSFINDEKKYEEPDEVVLQMSFKDMILDDFLNKADIISSFRSGMELVINSDRLFYNNNGKNELLARLSNISGKPKLNKYISRGYVVKKAKIRFICAWKKKDPNVKTTYVVLPDIYLKKD